MKSTMAIVAVIAAAILHPAMVPAQGSLNGAAEGFFNFQNNLAAGAKNLDRRFVKQATRANLFEIELAEIALDNSTNDAVTAYAQQLITDHTASNLQLDQIATTNDFNVPDDIDVPRRQLLGFLSQLSGNQFDRAFARVAVLSHQQTIRLYRAEARRGDNPDLQAFAEDTLPLLREHLADARDLADDLGVVTNQ